MNKGYFFRVLHAGVFSKKIEKKNKTSLTLKTRYKHIESFAEELENSIKK